MCSAGRNQSPINLAGAVDADLPAIDLDYPNRGLVDEVNKDNSRLVRIVVAGDYFSQRNGDYASRRNSRAR